MRLIVQICQNINNGRCVIVLLVIYTERVEYNVFLFDETLKGSKSLKIFKISLTFRFDIYQNPFTQEKILKF
jgi:hypothetical protein